MDIRLLVDLHTHTTASDGVHSPEENIRMAKEAGLAALAITDHDTTAGIGAAVREGERLGVLVVPGVEISTVADGQDIHVLGYYMNAEDETFQARLAELRSVRDKRNDMLVERLGELGIAITMEEVEANLDKTRRPGDTVGRPHIAALLVKKGHAADIKDAFDKYLGKHGAAYVNPPRIRPEDAIQWIHEAGGCAVLAHPGLYGMDSLIPALAQAGLDGLEAFHSDHSPEEEERYRALAESLGLLITAGSDFHGKERFHGPIGSRSVDIGILDSLKTRGRS